MSDIQDELITESLSTSQIKRAAQHLRYFLMWVFVASLFNIVMYHLFYDYSSNHYNIWMFFNMVIVVISCILTRKFIYSKKITPLNLDAWCQLLCLTIGSSIGIGVLIINHYLMVENSEITGIHVLLSSLMTSSIYIIGIVYLTQRLRYFIYMFIPSILPVILAKIIFASNVPHVYNYLFYVWFTIVFISAILTHRIHRRLNLLNIHNQFYLRQSKIHLDESSLLQQQLEQEIDKCKGIENDLQMHNQLLEQKVKERTYHINQINDRLENHQANLDFAHETAGISSWLWNIEKRTVELSSKKTEVRVIQYDNNLEQINLLIHPEDKPEYNKLMRRHLRGFSERFEATYRILKNNQWCWIEDIGKVIARDPITHKPLRMVGIHRDIEQEIKDQEQLKLAANVFNQVEQGVFVLDNNLCFIEVNPFFSKLVDIPNEQILGKHLFDLTSNTIFEISNKHAEISQQVILHGEYDAEVQEQFISGKHLTLWLHINAVRDDNSKIINYIGVITDLTERIKHEQRLAYLENYNLLTDLPNRVYFNLHLHQLLVSKSGPINHFAIIRINIDRFRNFNEFLNNQAGDELLKQFSKRLKQTSFDALLIAYLNNDDFALIYNLGSQHNFIGQKAEELMSVLQKPFNIFGQEHTISISMGIALFPEHGRQISSLNNHAEIALVEAKKLGGNTIYYYDNKSNSIFENDIHLERDLRQAIKNDDLEVYYQPKISARDMSVHGFEALIRWSHPDYGVIQPDAFLPIAEESSLISEIGQYVMLKACKQIHEWQQLGFQDIRISVNVVAQQIHRGQLMDDINLALSTYDVAPQSIELELTESSLVNKSEEVIELLNKIKERGIEIALDDFGTGYSSLAYLTDYPINTLKIDKSFISKIGKSKDEAIVNAIIAMGKALGLSLVAEGVETFEQIEYLQQRGCDFFQGYYFSKPLNSTQSTEFLNQKVMQ
ncbi:EAL domain-containing protein [Acinetobacter shaoyimingii]|uniref:cyclic-guanylate-specific phosphodiesterase n=1 Tax=Acinetobacter shaoyimingii TaxID=2715164 RepID=A0A6G8RTW8_9GAMM|nr:EAL domain-containing protein [Acinetobacter shaoyimingii]QIO05409.1 EAL domain-containing protein [Acinetobacter shaoyimingii]